MDLHEPSFGQDSFPCSSTGLASILTIMLLPPGRISLFERTAGPPSQDQSEIDNQPEDDFV